MAKLFRITTVPLSVEKLLGNQLTFMNQHYEVTAISSDQEYLDRVGADLGIKTHAIEMTRQITPFQDLKSLWQMYRYIKKQKPEIVHTHTPKAGLIGMLAARLAGVKIRLHTVAGLPLMEAQGVKRKLLDAVEKLTYACATKVYPNSKGLYDFILKEKLVKAEKLKVIGNGSTNGIDTSHFDPDLYSEESQQDLRKKLGIAENDFVFVFVGRLVKDKGINELVSAFKSLQRSSSPTSQPSTPHIHKSTNPQLSTSPNQPISKLLLVGPLEQDLDPLTDEILQEIETNPDISCVGYQSDVRPYLSIADALVFPSYREGFPNVVLQAGAMGLPSIVSDINGCNEIIENNKNGLIIPVKDEGAITTAMKQLSSDKIIYEKMKNSSRSMITQHYKQNIIWELILKEYKSFS
jgi:glycosyltransferase involved in cell wall biosynthesis